jgi:hypothetical protein
VLFQLSPKTAISDEGATVPSSNAARIAVLGHSCKDGRHTATIAAVQNPGQREGLIYSGENPFRPAAMVIVTLGNPREKFWGAILALIPEGLTLCGIELASFDDLVSMVKDGESFSPSVVFFPMHRVERMELDLPDGSIASLSQRFASKTGLDPAAVLSRHAGRQTPEDSR